MINCDLCGKEKECSPRQIEGREYDLCAECWEPLAEKLKGKGHKTSEIVFLPPPQTIGEREDEEPEEPPSTLPKIFGITSSLEN